MGNRISIQFEKDKEKSVVLFSHWDGSELLNKVIAYKKQLLPQLKGQFNPIDRLEPNTVMVDFIRFLTRGMKIVDSNYYLAKSKNDGDNSDNGHHIIKL